MTSAVVAVAVAVVRIALDLRTDPNAQNLLPFELAIAAFVGAIAASFGLGLAPLARRGSPTFPRSAP